MTEQAREWREVDILDDIIRDRLPEFVNDMVAILSAPEQARDTGGLRDVIAEGIEAFRLTREYVGEDTLPAIEGWSWFDWCEKARAILSQGAAHEERGLDVDGLLAELSESPLPGARYAYEVVKRRLDAYAASRRLATPEAAPDPVGDYEEWERAGAATPTPTTEEPNSITETPEDNR